MPQELRNNIDFRVAQWREQHPHANDLFIASRKVAMFLPQLQPHRHARRLPFARPAVSGRIPLEQP